MFKSPIVNFYLCALCSYFGSSVMLRMSLLFPTLKYNLPFLGKSRVEQIIHTR